VAYDIVIKNGNVIDGSGMPAMRGDVAIKDGKIVAVFAPEQLQIGKKELVQDVPSGETRLIQKAEGIHHSIVNGRVILNHNQETGELPGEVLRSSAYRGAHGRS